MARFYTESFFDAMEDGALASANVVLPIVLELLEPNSLIDFGCGRGAWLRVARQLGVANVLGLDGPHVAPQSLLIPPECFRAIDLRRPVTSPEYSASLALCLEVAEHLPRRAAAPLVAALTASAPAVLFSAAIPGQPGTHHINEQFPEYWHSMFAHHDYVALDVIRPVIRGDTRVAPWYAQNILLYVSKEYQEGSRRLRQTSPVRDPEDLLPWVYGGLWRGRVNFTGPLSVFKVVMKRALLSHFQR